MGNSENGKRTKYETIKDRLLNLSPVETDLLIGELEATEVGRWWLLMFTALMGRHTERRSLEAIKALRASAPDDLHDTVEPALFERELPEPRE